MTHRNVLWAAVLFLAAAAPAMAQGLIIPDEPDLPPLALVRHRVTVEIDRQAATTTVEQVFLNNTDRQLEAQYVFPIPRGAAMSRFTMMVNGKQKAGEVVEKNQARQIYNSIVHRAQDPGLLEYLGGDVFRANIFPIAPRGNQTITLRFEQILPSQDALVNYTYPVRATTKRGPTVQGEFSIETSIKSAAPILNVYSPSHPVSVARANDREAKVTYSDRRTTLDKDFQLYYSVSDKEIGLNLVTYRPNPKDPGFFMLLLAPKSTLQVDRVVERDIVFVVDTSGSMAGEKIKQARNALKYLVTKLNDGDRFNIVPFSSFADSWQKGLVSAKERREDGLKFAETLIAQGGTDIAGAFDAAASVLLSDPTRPSYIVFMTDGKPTMGETTDPKRILAKVMAARGGKNGDTLRLFTWGVGYDVDTHLLDDMANQGGGISEYVRPEEDIAAKVAAFANKASQPVLTGLDLQVLGNKVQLVNLHPRTLPDLYAGGQVVLLGRYTGEGDIALQLTGRVNGKTETFTYEGKFTAEESKSKFIELLWAQRRIGHLLDQIRLHGETKEMVDDVIRLSKEYGIQTPYTSQLILEDDRQLGQFRGAPASDMPRRKDVASGGALAGKSAEVKKLDDLAKAEPAPVPPAVKPEMPRNPEPARPAEEAKAAAMEKESAENFARRFKDKDGKAGVDVAERLRRLKQAEQAVDPSLAEFRKAAGTRFFLYNDMWIDEKFDATADMTTVKFGSEAYFKLIEKAPQLVEALKLGTKIVITTAEGNVVAICGAGAEKLTDAQIDAVFVAKKK
ncbi:MAG TPA: VIT domain-containing protein [Planctomycetota bacterium]|nr:VIT domain-containing protein [Planctomycetota bacterium]